MKLNTVKISIQNALVTQNKCTLMQLVFSDSTFILEILIVDTLTLQTTVSFCVLVQVLWILILYLVQLRCL